MAKTREARGASFSGLGHSLTATHSLASLTRAPSLRSVAVLRCAQPSLRSARGFATPLAPLSQTFTVRVANPESRCGRALFRTHGRTYRRGPMGPRPTHVCLVRETRLLPPKAGRLASRSAKPTLDGSSLNNRPYPAGAKSQKNSNESRRLEARKGFLGRMEGVGESRAALRPQDTH